MSIATDLASLGWRTDTTARLNQAIRDFQGMWNLGAALTVDGDAGPKTKAALKTSLDRRKAGKGDISEHFSAREFACGCGGTWSDCRRIWAQRSIVQAAEAYRNLVGPFTPARGCRCTRENARVGGAKNSQHLYGAALDLPVYNITSAKVQSLGLVSGIGVYITSNGSRVPRHIDVRHRSGNNTTGASVALPTIWDYGTWKSSVLTPRPDLAKPKPAPKPESWFTLATEADLRRIVREELAALPREVWRFKNEGLEPERDAYRILREINVAEGLQEALNTNLTVNVNAPNKEG